MSHLTTGGDWEGDGLVKAHQTVHLVFDMQSNAAIKIIFGTAPVVDLLLERRLSH